MATVDQEMAEFSPQVLHLWCRDSEADKTYSPAHGDRDGKGDRRSAQEPWSVGSGSGRWIPTCCPAQKTGRDQPRLTNSSAGAQSPVHILTTRKDALDHVCANILTSAPRSQAEVVVGGCLVRERQEWSVVWSFEWTT